MAEQIMRTPEPAFRLHPKCASCTAAETSHSPCQQCAAKALRLQRHSETDAGGGAPQIVDEVLGTVGEPLDSSTRVFFESRFGYDFSHVTVHCDARAAESAKAVDALAYTVGHDVVFGAGQFSPGTVSGKRLLAHELAHVVQQTAGAELVQRVTDPVNHEPIRANAQACLLHLHGNETNARAVAQFLYNNYCVNFVHIDHPGRRHILVDVPGHAGVSCAADPNRIFDDAVVNSQRQWSEWNENRPACLRDPVMGAARRAVIAYRDNRLCPAIRECRGQAASGAVCTQAQGLPTAVFHNNTPGAPLTIHSYQAPGGNHHTETETDPGRLTEPGTTPPVVLANPHIEPGQNPDNFVLTTDPADFRFFVHSRRNVVLQKLNPPNDGSLSVALSASRYANVEAQLPVRNPASNLPENRALGEELMASLRVTRGPCPPTAAPPAASTSPAQTVSPAPPANPSPTRRLPLMPKAATATGRPPRLQRKPITSADLKRRSPRSLDRFMRHVYDLQMQLWTAQGATYVHRLPAADLVSLAPGDTAGAGVQLRRTVATIVHNMLADARRDLAAAKAAGTPNARGVTALAVKSGYRSAPTQLTIWEKNFLRYYDETKAARQAMPGGEHGESAAKFLADYINERVHTPGYSQHQRGETVDLTFEQNGWIQPDTDPANIARWRSSWFFGWLTANAARYGFAQNPRLNEPWHWEFHPTPAPPGLLEIIGQWLLKIIEWLIRVLKDPYELLRPFVGGRGPEQEETGAGNEPPPPDSDRGSER